MVERQVQQGSLEQLATLDRQANRDDLELMVRLVRQVRPVQPVFSVYLVTPEQLASQVRRARSA